MTGPLGVVAALAGLGLANAAYGVLVAAGRVRGGWYAGCATGDEACSSGVLGSRWGRIFGVPPWVVGTGYYLLILVTTALRVVHDFPSLLAVSLAASVLAAFYGAFLLWTLLVRFGNACPLCYAAHTLNLALIAAVFISAG